MRMDARTTALWMATLLLASVGYAEPPPSLKTGGTTLRWTTIAGSLRPEIVADDGTVATPVPVILGIAGAGDDALRRVEASYASVRPTDAGLVASATVKTLRGSTIDVRDTWAVPDPKQPTLCVDRTLTVRSVGDGDVAFESEFECVVPRAKTLADASIFIPGLWYDDTTHTPPSGLTTDVGQHDFILREDRMALPLVSVRDRASGATLTLEHRAPDGATVVADDAAGRVVDARLQFGALGIRRDHVGLRVAFRFPGSEGEQTSIRGYKPDLRTAERLHPLVVGATQHYTLALRLTRAESFPKQIRDAWRDAFAAAKPEVVPFDGAAVLAASVGVLDHYAITDPKTPGIPFSVRLPEGVKTDVSFQMGFVGQQLPCASYLIDEGLRTHRPALIAKGERIADFWARESLSPAGVPRTWYDVKPTPHWRDYETYLRVATDGASGLLRAWQIERTARRDKPAWLKFCRATGDWLIQCQNEDGSWCRSWTFDGKPKSESRTSTLHPVRLLVDLSCATGDMKYRAAAIRAAEYMLKNSPATYVGGTPDNPDVIDKEAGWIAFDSYLALYDVTGDKQWLDAAIDAATFTETWTFGWNVPLPIDATEVGVPRVKTFAGANLIATGHSAVDNFLAYASLSYARLAIYTGDDHFADVARLLQHNSAQFVDLGGSNGGSNGYGQPGLLVEAFDLAVRRGHSVGTWLPWCTSAIVEPMARMREAFGTIDVDAMMQQDDRAQRNAAWARTRGFAEPVR